ncbi:hypothetical protein ACNFIA_13175 [Pseudomonas sp. NY15437]|uniref:nucleotidyltransferase domain-containing protein n=1 Tax=Pseudomonas sp. NY15437 TaxID=3400360 RepID=UPI003A8712C7
MSYVIIECGSIARGDATSQSDIDMVCIWRGKAPNFSEIKEKYNGVMFYSAETILKMKEKGSLFLTHLDVEGKFISGNADILELFSGFRPPVSSLVESISRTNGFIQGIRWYPNSCVGYYWLLDVLYVSLRNCMYCANALNGSYKFGYVAAIQEMGLSNSDLEVLLEIRNGKYLYRRGEFPDSKALDDIELQEICSKISGQKVELHRGGVTDWNIDWSFDYWSERLIERAIINGEHSDSLFLDKLRNHNYNRFSLRGDVFSIVLSHQKMKWNDYIGLAH